MKDPPPPCLFNDFLLLFYRKFFSSEMAVSPNISHKNLTKSLFIPSTPKGKLQFAPFFMSNKRSLHIVGLSSVRFCICDNKT